MKYNFHINQRAVIESGLDKQLDLTDLALFDFIYDLMNNNRVPKTLVNGVEYTQIRHGLVSAQCPLLRINHRDPLRKRMLKLVDAGLLIRYDRNQEENQSLYARGPRFSTLVFSNGQSGDLPLNDSTLPFDNDTPCRQSTTPPAADERHDNTINNNSTSENSTEDNFSRTNSTSKNISSGRKNSKKEYDLSFVNIAFEDVFKEWLEYKKSRNESYKDQHSLEVCYRRLLTLSNNDPHTAQLIIEEAIASNYKGFFELKQSKQSNYGNNSDQTSGGFFCQLADSLKGSGGIH